MNVVIIDYGVGNTKSVQFALKRLGIEAVLANNFDLILKADKVIFPGVGHASSAMEQIKRYGLEQLIPTLKQPVLGVCLGMQLMCKFSEEGNTDGLGIFDLGVIKFSDKNKVPQIGWNTIFDLKSKLLNGLDENEFMYFVHSYYVPLATETIATANYGLDYSAALQKNNFYGCQFHPEKSGDKGELILKNFIDL
jgi:glutamine amidotransferase